ncbi:MAG: hypothetical protein S4CHLAM20_09040 [Chlamydiia bacterium]|nr:hypothetical protein [Chlamydiia bacterium]
MSQVANCTEVQHCLDSIRRELGKSYEDLQTDLKKNNIDISNMTDQNFCLIIKVLVDFQISKLVVGLPDKVSVIPRGVFCLINLNHIEIAGVTFIPRQIKLLSNLRHLDLSDGSIKVLPREVGAMPSLRCLKLRNNNITAIPKIFENSNLKELDVADNNIQRYSDLFGFDPLVGKAKLNCVGNPLPSLNLVRKIVLFSKGKKPGIDRLESNVRLQRIGDITLLQKSKEAMDSIAVSFQSMRIHGLFFKQMGELYLSLSKLQLFNYIIYRYLPDFHRFNAVVSIASLWSQLPIFCDCEKGRKNLEKAHQKAHKERFKSLRTSPDLNSKKANDSITRLEIKGDKAWLLPESILKFKNLESLTLTNIKFLPLWIGGLKKLRVLQIFSCDEVEIPIQILKLKNLRELTFASGGLRQIPSWISKFKELKVLDLSFNEITSIEGVVSSLEQLKERNCKIDLSFNPFVEARFVNSSPLPDL